MSVLCFNRVAHTSNACTSVLEHRTLPPTRRLLQIRTALHCPRTALHHVVVTQSRLDGTVAVVIRVNTHHIESCKCHHLRNDTAKTVYERDERVERGVTPSEASKRASFNTSSSVPFKIAKKKRLPRQNKVTCERELRQCRGFLRRPCPCWSPSLGRRLLQQMGR